MVYLTVVRIWLVSFFLFALMGCAKQPLSVNCADANKRPLLSEPVEPVCANNQLTAYESLLVLAPHPDDETLGFAGLITAFQEQGKQVKVVVSTDGDAYCEACRFWKSGSVRGATCDALDLSNLTTVAADSFAEIRRNESRAAATILGLPAPTFFSYPDTGLAAAWKNFNDSKPDEPLYRSDFSKCDTCESCEDGYGGGPVTELTASILINSLRQQIAATSENTLIATTHWLDGHADHSALGNFVNLLNTELPRPRAIALAVIHAHTPKNTPHADCWYPAPEALICPCADESCATKTPDWIASLSRHRFRPEWPAALPDDADYGETKQLCLPERLYHGDSAIKLQAISAYKSQLGFLARTGTQSDALAGMMDCNGYLISFLHRTEAFVLIEPH